MCVFIADIGNPTSPKCMIDTSQLFSHLPAHARAWTYIADRPMSTEEQGQLREQLDLFSRNWSSHGRSVASAYELFDDRVLILVAEVPGGDLSGCGIDKSLHVIDGFASKAGFSWLDPLHVAWRENGTLTHGTRAQFRHAADAGRVDENTQVLDAALTTLDELRQKGLEKPARSSWHARLVGIVQATVLFLVMGLSAHAQGYINQEQAAEILSECSADLDRIPEMTYSYKVLYSSMNNSVIARATLYKILGEGDVDLGAKRAKLAGFLNRVIAQRAEIGDTLIVPDRWEEDFCAYSPFPRFYPGAISLEKLFVIDKTIQAWAAYENGRLARWGIVNTGAESYRTPNGRFNFNWKTEYRVSSESPPGEPWEMYWVFNFVVNRGIHVHQYPLPTGGPTSHGCVRLIEDDAKWIYDWADQWRVGSGSGYNAGGYGTVVKPGTTVLVIGEDPPGKPQPFVWDNHRPRIRLVDLPDDPYSVAPGTDMQRYFDRVNGRS